MRSESNNAWSLLEQSLPNGFHDAEVVKFAFDFSALSLSMTLAVDVSMKSDDTVYLRLGQLRVGGVAYINVEPMEFGSIEPGFWQVDTEVVGATQGTAAATSELFETRIFLQGPNASIRLRAATAEWYWLEGTSDA